MMAEKKYYWIKIKDTFMTSDKVDFLMSQKDGANYVLLYQMLCLMCLNTEGELSRKIGEVIIPFDVDKITRDCKYFTKDTVIVALELFKKLGMIYQEENGCLRISEFENMVGSSKTDDHTKKLNAERQARFRANHKKELFLEENNVTVTDEVTLKSNADIRDKILDIRYINSKSSAKAGKSAKSNSDSTLLKNIWNDCYIKLFNHKPDENVSEEKKGSYWAGVVSYIKKRLEKYDVDTLEGAIRYAALESWVVEGGFVINTVLSDSVVLKSMNNSPHSNFNNKNNYQNTHVNLENKIGLEEWNG